MGKIDERIIHLKSDLEELMIISEKSEASHNTNRKYLEILNDLDLSHAKNLPILLQTTKNALSVYLEYLRDRVNIIRKISPETAEKLDAQVNYHEKLGNYFVKILENSKTPKQYNKNTTTKEFEKHMAELVINSHTVDESVDTCYNFLKDMLDYLEG